MMWKTISYIHKISVAVCMGNTLLIAAINYANKANYIIAMK